MLVTVDAVLGGGADGGLGELDGLALIVDVGVGADLGVPTVERLEDDHALAVEVGGVEGEGDVHGAGGVGGGELRLGGDGLAVLALQGVAGGFHHELALDGVLAARNEVLVGDGINDDGLGVDDRLLVAVDAVLGGGADGRLEDAERLLGIVEVLVLADSAAVSQKLLEDDDLLARVTEQVDGDLHLHGSGLTGGREALLHGPADDVAGLLVYERGAHGVRLAGHEPGELDVIGDEGLLIGQDQLVAIHTVARARVDIRLGLKAVVDGAEVDRDGIALDGDALDLHEDEALVRRAAQLLDGVGVVRQRAQLVVCRDGLAVLGKAEPDTGLGVEVLLCGGVVGVGLMGVLVPLG